MTDQDYIYDEAILDLLTNKFHLNQQQRAETIRRLNERLQRDKYSSKQSSSSSSASSSTTNHQFQSNLMSNISDVYGDDNSDDDDDNSDDDDDDDDADGDEITVAIIDGAFHSWKLNELLPGSGSANNNVDSTATGSEAKQTSSSTTSFNSPSSNSSPNRFTNASNSPLIPKQLIQSKKSKSGGSSRRSPRSYSSSSSSSSSNESGDDNENKIDDIGTTATKNDWSLYGVFTNLVQLYNMEGPFDRINNNEESTSLRLVICSVPVAELLGRAYVKLYTCTLTNGEFKIPAQIIPPVDWKDTQEDVETQLEPGTIISVEEGNYSNKIQQRGDTIQTLVTTSLIIQIRKFEIVGKIPSMPLSTSIQSVAAHARGLRTVVVVMEAGATAIPSATDCHGVVCALAHNSVANDTGQTSEVNNPDPNQFGARVHYNVLQCLAQFELPSLEYVAKMNPKYTKNLADCHAMPTHHKRQCYYYYFAVQHFNSRRGRMELPYCIRKRIHREYPCEGGVLCDNRLNGRTGKCPTCNAANFTDAYNFPKND